MSPRLWLFLLMKSIQMCRCVSVSNCDDPFQCSGENIEGTNLQIRGYKAAFGRNTSIIIAGYAWCDGALSCSAVRLFDSKGTVTNSWHYCRGSGSCSNISRMVYSQSASLRGSNAGTHSNHICDVSLSSCRVSCEGDQSCSYSNVTLYNGYISAEAAYSLYNTVIVSSGTASNRYNLDVYGYLAGYGATFICNANHSCGISCHGYGCYGLYIKCLGTCNILPESSDTVYPMTDARTTTPDEHILYDSSIITSRNDMHCSAQMTSMKFDSYIGAVNFNTEIVATGDGPLCCRGEASCERRLIQHNQFGNASVVCSGFVACVYSTINTNGPIFCEGSYSCQNSNLTTTDNIYCFGSYSCLEATLSGAQNIYCSGMDACANSFISSNAIALIIYLLGRTAGHASNVSCSSNQSCFVFCGGASSCGDLRLVCNGTCRVNCTADTGCPIGWDSSSNPTMSTSTTLTTTSSANEPSKAQETTNKPTTNNPTTSPISLTTSPTSKLSFNTTSPISLTTSTTPHIMDQTNPTKRTRIMITTGSQHLVISLMVFTSFLLLALLGLCYSKLCNVSDTKYHFKNVLWFGYHAVDYITDCSFALWLYDQGQIVLFLFSILFVFLPSILSSIQLNQNIPNWIKSHNSNRRWFESYISPLYIVCFVTGSVQTSVHLFTSNLFGLTMFGLQLTRYDQLKLHNQHLWSNIAFESIPQLIIQSVSIFVHNQISDITILSMIFSVSSIIMAPCIYISRRHIMLATPKVSGDLVQMRSGIVDDDASYNLMTD
eukprot:214095_1